jgi:hypothetical protein
MQVKAECVAADEFGDSVRVMLAWQQTPMEPEQYCWLNIRKEQLDFQQGDTVDVTLRKVFRSTPP